MKRNETEEDGSPSYAPSTLRGWKTMFDQFFAHSGKGNLDSLQPLLESNLKKWKKASVVKKAKKFTQREMGAKLICESENKIS